MAIIQFDIPDTHVPRAKIAFQRLLEVNEAIDIENPTNEEFRLKVVSICIRHLKAVWKAEEWKMNNESFEFIDVEIE